MCLVPKSVNRSQAKGDLVIIQTLLLLNANYFVIMLTRYWSLSQQGDLQPHSKSKTWQLSTQLSNGLLSCTHLFCSFFVFCFLESSVKFCPIFEEEIEIFCKETNWYDRDTYIYILMNPPLPFIRIQPDTVYITANPWQFITTNSLVYSPVTWLDQGLLHQWLNSWPKRLQFAEQIPVLFTDSKHRQLGIVKIPIMNISFVWTGYGAI